MAHKVDGVSGVCGGIRFCVNIESTRMGPQIAQIAQIAQIMQIALMGVRGKGGEGKR